LAVATRALARAIGVLAAAGLCLLPSGGAASCLPLGPAEQEARADVVVDGTIVALTVGVDATDLEVAVDQVIKGTVGSRILVKAPPPGRVTADDVPFRDGWSHWRLYLRERAPGAGEYYTSLCDGTRAIPPPASGPVPPRPPREAGPADQPPGAPADQPSVEPPPVGRSCPV
jgi:hypothetical protein